MQRTWTLTAVTALVVAGVAFWLGRTTAPEPEQAVTAELPTEPETAETPVDPASMDPDATEPTEIDMGGALSAPKVREDYLLAEAKKERERADRLAAEIEALKAGKTPEGEAADEADAPAAELKARYVFEGAEKALTALDLDAAGEAYQNMTPLITELLDSIAAGEPKMHLQQEISKWNMTLVNQAVKMQNGGLTGDGINGVFTHPAIQVNYIYATLKDGEHPLTENQEAALKELGDRFVQEEAKRVARYDENSLELEKLVDEADLKSRFYADVDAMLTAAQVEILHPESMRGRIQADLFSSGLLWAMRVQAIGFKERADLATTIAENVMRHFQLSSDHEEDVLELAGDYAAGFSDQFLAHEADSLDQIGLFHEARVRESARHLTGLLKALMDRLPLDENKRKTIRGTAFSLVPTKRNSS
ncbi:MAG: hypothetical protein QNJ98_02775 [Planctomycetota bacterium]|nr:hypothetical protein [Planctomycetota bacterium]